MPEYASLFGTRCRPAIGSPGVVIGGPELSDFKTVASVADVLDGAGLTIQICDREIALFNIGGAFYAIENTCCHRGGPVGDGDLRGNIVSCPWHGWRFDVTSGECLNSPGDRLRTYEVVVEGTAVRVKY